MANAATTSDRVGTRAGATNLARTGGWLRHGRLSADEGPRPSLRPPAVKTRIPRHGNPQARQKRWAYMRGWGWSEPIADALGDDRDEG